MNRYQAICRQFYGNRLLFGDPADAGMVAVEIASRDEVEMFKRRDGDAPRERRPLKLFALIADREMLKGFARAHEVRAARRRFSLSPCW